MARIWFAVEGAGLVPVEVGDRVIEAIVKKGHADIRVSIWKGDLALSGDALVKMKMDRIPK